jgi:hypothetical protein
MLVLPPTDGPRTIAVSSAPMLVLLPTDGPRTIAVSFAPMLVRPPTVVSTHCLQREGRGGFFAH